MSELAVMEEKKLKVFQKDTEKLGKSTSDFIANFYPSYGVSDEVAIAMPQENSLDLCRF